MNASVNGSDNILLDFLVISLQNGKAGSLIACTCLIALAILYFLSSSIIFASYTYVFQCNQKKDKTVPIYPIIKHFYKSVIYMQSVLYFGISANLILFLTQDKSNGFVVLFPLLELLLIYFLSIIVNSVHNILLFALALRTFMIFICPKRWHFTIKRSTFQYLLRFLYIIVIFWSITLRVWKIYCSVDIIRIKSYNSTIPSNETVKWSDEEYRTFSASYRECVEASDTLFTNCYVSTDLLVLSSSILYFFVFLKMRKFPKQASPMKTKPEKFIFYQTIIIIFTKILVVPFIYFHFSTKGFFFLVIVVADIVTTPFVIQVSYLICNQSALDTLLSVRMTNLKEWFILLCGDRPVAPS